MTNLTKRPDVVVCMSIKAIEMKQREGNALTGMVNALLIELVVGLFGVAAYLMWRAM